MNPFDLPLSTILELAATHDTPFYVVSRSQLIKNFRLLDDNLSAAKLYYAMKANPHTEILRALLAEGMGFDVASKGEIEAARAVGADPRDDLIFADTVKDPKQIAFANSIGLDDFTFDNASEITQIAKHAPGAGVFLRIVVSNQGSVAHLSHKFGAPANQAVPLLLAARDQGLLPRGISFHVGSQCLDSQRYIEALDTTALIFAEATAAGMTLENVDIGGGFPVRYGSEKIDLAVMGRAIDQHFRRRFGAAVNLVAEPGRAIVGDAMILVTKVISESVRSGRNWLYFDDGTYGSFMEVLLYQIRFPLRTSTKGPRREYVLAGPTCDSISHAMGAGISVAWNCQRCTWTIY